MSFNFGRASNTPPVVRNLIILNVAIFVISLIYQQISRGASLNFYLGLFYYQSPLFQPWQIVTHMFSHGSFFHLFFNMWALWMFGKTLESVWGSKRFLIYFLITGLGAAFFHTLVNFIQYAPDVAAVKDFYSVDRINLKLLNTILQPGSQFGAIGNALRIPTVGASGAVFGILLAFGMLFPNTPLFIIPIPFPIKAKYLVMGYGAVELYLGISGQASNIAHFAHLGGMVFGFILIKVWNKYTRDFY